SCPPGAIPEGILLPLLPRFAVGIGRGAIVQDPAIGRPAETPVAVDTEPGGIAVVPAHGEVATRTVDAGVDPHRAVGRAVIAHLAEAGRLRAGGARDRAFRVLQLYHR